VAVDHDAAEGAAPASPTQAGAPGPARKKGLIARLVDGLLAAMLVAMLGMVLLNVILRYGFGTGISASEELSRTLFVWITFIGAVVATREGTHLSVDSLVAHLPHGGRVVCAVLSELIVVGCCGLIFWGTLRQHAVNASMGSLVTGMPMIWVFGVGYIVSAGCALLGLYKLWRIATRQISDRELFDSPSTEVAAESVAAGKTGL
jgi:TRAP-type C4-dicarboxylate transport system permease small subunit